MPSPENPKLGSGRTRSSALSTRGWPLVIRIVIALALLGAVSLLVIPDVLGLDHTQFFAFSVALRPQATAVVIALALLLLLVWRRTWPEMVAVLAICAIAAAIVLPRAIPHPAAASAAESHDRTFTVLSFNVDQGGADVARIADTVRKDRPDLIVLPESANRFRTKLAAAIPGLGYRSWSAVGPAGTDVAGVSVFTAADLGDVTMHRIDEGVFDPWMSFTGGKLGSMRLVAVHVSAPTPGKIVQWPKELASLQQWCGQQHSPVVIAGDFNATLDHREFRDGIRGCLDAGEMTGKGLVATWPSNLPKWFGAQIDHVLGGGGVVPTGLQVLDLPGSDHRALLATLALPAQ